MGCVEILAHGAAIDPEPGRDGTDGLCLLIEFVDLVIQCLSPLLPFAALSLSTGLPAFRWLRWGHCPSRFGFLYRNRRQGEASENG